MSSADLGSSTSLLDRLLDRSDPGDVDVPMELWGFGGAHGGLVAALLVGAVVRSAPAATVRSVSVQFHRSVRGPVRIATTPVHAGRTLLTAVASATTGAEGASAASATVLASLPRDEGDPASRLDPGVDGWSAPPPSAPPPAELDRFAIPPELVPFGRFLDVRPIGPARPYAGGATPELTAWVRLAHDDRPVDLLRSVILLDALAPSIAAVLPAPRAIPTVEYNVRPVGRPVTTSPWLLLHAASRSLGDRWIHEDISAWDLDGHHVATASQLRLVA